MGCGRSSAHERCICRGTSLSASAPPVKALAFSGGGFLSHTACAGFTAGLLHTLRRRSGDAAVVDLFGNFSMISSISGGSWYAAQLAYSKQFLTLIEELAADPIQSGKRWNDEFIHRLLNGGAERVSRGIIPDVVLNFIKGMAKIPVTELIQLVSSFASQGEAVNWVNVIVMLLKSTSDIGSDVRLASPSMPWAAGKDWLVGVAIKSPSPEDSFVYIVQHLPVPTWFTGSSALTQLKYAWRCRDNAAATPPIMPAKFSWRFGSEVSDPSPYPFCYCTGDRLEYRASTEGAPLASSAPLECVYDGAICRHAGKLPLGHVVGSSSAFAGNLIDQQELQLMLRTLNIDLNVWVTCAEEGQTFAVAEDILTQVRGSHLSKESAELAALFCLHTIIDGGLADGTGIAQAVAAGATEVTSVQIATDWMNVLLTGGGDASSCGPIFAETVDDLESQLARSIALHIPEESASHVSRLAFCTLLVSTVDNLHWGVRAGAQVTIHVFFVTSDVGIGGSTDFYNYGKLCGGIVVALTDSNNAEIVERFLHDAM